MILQGVPASGFRTAWRRVEEHLATNSPHLWGFQVQLVVPAAVCGLLVSLILELISPHLPEVRPWLVGSSILLQIYFLVVWGLRLFSVPRPPNVVGYSSPILAAVLLCVAAILVGPTVLLFRQLESSVWRLSFPIYLGLGEALLILAMFRFAGGIALPNTRNVLAMSVASIFLLSVLYGWLTWLAPHFLNLIALTVCLFVACAARLMFCLASGVRRRSDAMWLSIMLLLPVALSLGAAMVMSLNGVNVFRVTDQFLTELSPSLLWLMGSGLLVLVVVWIDLVSEVRVRLMMLPLRE